MKKTILFLCVITLFSCKQDSYDEMPLPFDVLGSWQWVSKSGGFAGGYFKVDSTQKYILTILPNNEYIWCKNGDCSKGRWSYGTLVSKSPKNKITLMDFIKPNSNTDFPLTLVSYLPIVKNDTINFSPYCNDCFGFEFKRFKK
jgi:hypothetical protein